MTTQAHDGDEGAVSQARFLADAAHEMRQPLQGLQFMIQALMRASADADTQEIAARMQQAVDCLQDMFDALVDLCRLEAGLLQPNRTTIEIGRLCRTVVEDLYPRKSSKARRFIEALPEAEVLSDEPILAQLVRNLVLNATSAAAGENNVRIAAECRQDMLHLEISAPAIKAGSARLDRAFIELKCDGVGTPAPRFAPGLATLARYAACLGHPLDIQVNAARRIAFTLSLPLVTEAASVASQGPLQRP